MPLSDRYGTGLSTRAATTGCREPLSCDESLEVEQNIQLEKQEGVALLRSVIGVARSDTFFVLRHPYTYSSESHKATWCC